MKKTKIITISILASLLLVPFMIPAAKAAPASYVGVAEEEYYKYDFTLNWASGHAAWTGFLADGMSDTIGDLFQTPTSERLGAVYGSWYQWNLNSMWSDTIDTILPENTSDILAVYGIPNNITYTEISTDVALWHIYDSEPGWVGSYNIVNDSASYALLSLYGGMAFSPMTLRWVAFAPNNMNWATFAATAQLGMTNYWGGLDPLAANTTVTALADGYSIYVPIAGFENNTKTITINATYTSTGVLNKTTFEYGADLLYTYELDIYSVDGAAPVIIDSPSDFTVFEGYTGESLSWTATDAYAGNYTITRDVTTVVTTTNWTSGTPVVYNIPGGLIQGVYEFTINFKDTSLNPTTHSLNMTVLIPDTTDPVITSSPADVVVESGVYPADFSWTATDANPGTYTISRNGTIVVGATSWTSGSPVNYSIEGGLQYIVGVTTYEITFSDFIGNSVSDTVTMTVNPMTPTTTTPPPRIPGFEPLIVIGIFVIGSISLLAWKKKKK